MAVVPPSSVHRSFRLRRFKQAFPVTVCESKALIFYSSIDGEPRVFASPRPLAGPVFFFSVYHIRSEIPHKRILNNAPAI